MYDHNTLYIIDTKKPFTGSIQSTLNTKTNKVQFRNCTFEEYNEIKGGGLIAISFEELQENYYKPFIQRLISDFKEITENRFLEMLSILPPKRWTRSGNKEFFFISEAYFDNLHACFLRVNDRYFEALKPINTPQEEIFNSIN